MPLCRDDYAFLARWVASETAIQLDADTAFHAEARLTGVASACGLETSNDVIAALRANRRPDLRRLVAEAMTTNETLFFRDEVPFRVLKDEVLPGLLKKKRAGEPSTVWSAACSTGQEIYSVAILLHEHFRDDVGRFRLFGSDLNRSVVERARAARYSLAELRRGLPPSLISRYFEVTGSEGRLRDFVRSRVEFHQQNLALEWSMGPVDVLLLRNVLLYFSTETKRAVLQRARRTLTRGGVLVLGAAESTLGIDDGWVRAGPPGSGLYVPRTA